MSSRNTIQKQLVYNAVKSLGDHPTADVIYKHIRKIHPGISKATVYRNLNLLAEKGEVRRVALPGSADVYDVHTEEHFHFQCKKCQKIMDIPLEVKPELTFLDSFVEDYDLDEYLVLVKGTCKECQIDL